MFQNFSKKPFSTHKCRGSQGRDFEEERLQRPILVVKSCKEDEKLLRPPHTAQRPNCPLISDYSFDLKRIRGLISLQLSTFFYNFRLMAFVKNLIGFSIFLPDIELDKIYIRIGIVKVNLIRLKNGQNVAKIN